LRPDR